jgi:pSer/pThr/pTyr-binding forkhead associated (FHA) protein
MECYRVGRSSENDIVLNNVTVSRRHAEVRCRTDGLYDVIDLDSTVGSYVMIDGEWVQFAQVTEEADEPIRLGEHKATIARLISGGDPLSRVTGPTQKDVPELSQLATAGGEPR